jgi:predicted ester cyclase
MSGEQNKEIFRRMIDEVWNKQNLDAADQLFAADHTSPDAAQLPSGPQGVKLVAGTFLKGIPDLKIEIEDLVASGDRVAGRLRERGTHTGDLMGIPPSGKAVDFGELAILRIAGGKIAESWYQPDMATMLQQIGAIPAFGAPAPAAR